MSETTKRIEKIKGIIQNISEFGEMNELQVDQVSERIEKIYITHLHQEVIRGNEILINELKELISLCENCGDFSNGIEAFGADEGIVNATQVIKNAKQRIADLERQIKE